MSIETTDHGTVDVGHAQISYQKIGSGPNLLFVHGWPLNGHTWRNVVPHLDGFTRYVIDLPGMGRSTSTAETPLDVRGHAASVVGVLDALALDNVVIVAQDSGGMIARYVAEQRPDVVCGLSMCGTEIPGVHAPLVKLFKMFGTLPGAKAMFKVSMGTGFVARTPLILGGTVYDKSLLDGELRTNLLDPILADDDAMTNVVAMIRAFSFDDIDDLAAVHRNLKMPTLLVWGDEDPFFPVEKARDMVEQFGGPTEFVSIPQCKLLVHEEYPQRFAELTRAFVTKHCGMAATI